MLVILKTIIHFQSFPVYATSDKPNSITTKKA
jgi:hypothetical protein